MANCKNDFLREIEGREVKCAEIIYGSDYRQKSLYGYCLQCGTYHVSGEKCPVIYRIEPKLEKPIDFNFYWEILSAWVLDFKPRVSVHQLRGLCERLTTITASNVGLDPIEALHCGKTPNTDFNLTPPSESQVKS